MSQCGLPILDDDGASSVSPVISPQNTPLSERSLELVSANACGLFSGPFLVDAYADSFWRLGVYPSWVLLAGIQLTACAVLWWLAPCTSDWRGLRKCKGSNQSFIRLVSTAGVVGVIVLPATVLCHRIWFEQINVTRPIIIPAGLHWFGISVLYVGGALCYGGIVLLLSIRQHRDQAGGIIALRKICAHCGYDKSELQSCPECGKRSASLVPWHAYRRSRAISVALICISIMCMVGPLWVSWWYLLVLSYHSSP
jgi:hypothetical protein